MLGDMLGLSVATHRTVEQLGQVLRSLPEVHVPTLFLSGIVVATILILRRLSPRLPGPLFAVVGAVAASAAFNFSARGITVIGPLAGGLPRIKAPDVSWTDILGFFPVAASCFLMIITQSAATARAYAVRHRDAFNENADPAGLSAAHCAAGLAGPVVCHGRAEAT